MYRFAELKGEACIVDGKGAIFKSYGENTETMENVAKARVASLNKDPFVEEEETE